MRRRKAIPGAAYDPPVAGKPQPIAGTYYSECAAAGLDRQSARRGQLAGRVSQPLPGRRQLLAFSRGEQKIVVTGAAVSTPYAASPTEPYPTGSPPDLRQWVLDQAHTKQEQVEEKDRWRQDTENLRAGGQLANGAPVA